MKRMLSYLLAVLLAWTPFQLSHAAMIGTAEQVAVTTANADRTAVLALINRSDIARELSAYGVKPADAEARIAAMSDAEVAALKQELETAPAGAGSGWVIVILVGIILWLVFFRKA